MKLYSENMMGLCLFHVLMWVHTDLMCSHMLLCVLHHWFIHSLSLFPLCFCRYTDVSTSTKCNNRKISGFFFKYRKYTNLQQNCHKARWKYWLAGVQRRLDTVTDVSSMILRPCLKYFCPDSLIYDRWFLAAGLCLCVCYLSLRQGRRKCTLCF